MKTSHLLYRRAARIVAALLLAGVCGLTGCISRPALCESIGIKARRD